MINVTQGSSKITDSEANPHNNLVVRQAGFSSTLYRTALTFRPISHQFCSRPFTFISTFICATYLTGWQFALGTGSSVLVKMWLPSLACFRDQRATVSVLTSLLLGLGLGLLLHQALPVLSNSICFLPVLSMLPYEDVIRPWLNVSVPSQTFNKPDS